MTFIQEENRFYMGDNPAQPQAEITFKKRGEDRLVVNHTFTDESLRGQGIARKLVERVAEYAREKGYKLLATCSYAKKVLSEDAFSDVYVGGRE
jgi:hypothetical protein